MFTVKDNLPPLILEKNHCRVTQTKNRPELLADIKKVSMVQQWFNSFLKDCLKSGVCIHVLGSSHALCFIMAL